MLEHLNKNYEDSFFNMIDGDLQYNFERNPFENSLYDYPVLLEQSNDYLWLNNKKYQNIQHIFNDPWQNDKNATDFQLELAKTGTNHKLYEDENIQHELIWNNRENFENGSSLIINSEVVKEDSKDVFRENPKQWKKRGPRKCKYSRWGKEDDKLLYVSIKNLIAEGEISKDFIENLTSSSINDSESDLEKVKISIDWKNPTSNLQKRIQKLFTQKDFSTRDKFRLRKLIKMFKGKPVDYDILMTEFPGKSKSIIDNAIKNFETLKSKSFIL